MLYFLLYEQLYNTSARFRVFRYTTFRTAFASLTALFLCIALGPWLINKLREFQIGQYIREEGPKSHQKKAGTPTMGGVLIIISIVVPTLLWADLRNPYVWIATLRCSASAGSAFSTTTPRSPSSAIWGSAGKRKLLYQFLVGFCLRRRAAVHAHVGRFQYRDEHPVLQAVQAVAADAGADGKSLDLRAGRGALLHLRGAGGGLHLQRRQPDRRSGRPGHRPDGDRRRRADHSHLRRRSHATSRSTCNWRATRAPPN